MICIILAALCSNAKDGYNKPYLRYTILFYPFYLSFSNHIHRFNSTQGSPRTIERLECHHRTGNLLDVPMVLLNDIVQVLALPQLVLLSDRLFFL
jgi:hypothetical protein